jgi:hypothetical protein
MNFRVQRQVTVAIENQPGRLAAVTRALANRGINIKDISILDSIEQGVIRIVVNDPASCRELLQEQGFRPIEADVLVVDLADAPGRLATVSQALADGGVNIDYAYGSEDANEQRMRIVMKVSPLARACDVLKALGEA